MIYQDFVKNELREFEWAKQLNSMARQASAERAWASIKRFYDNCKNPSIKKKGYLKFKKGRSVEYKTSGWQLSKDRSAINFRDGFKAGWFKMRGGCVLDRDEAAAINILAKALRELSRADALPNFQS